MEDEFRIQSTTFRRAIRFSCSPTYPSQFQNAYSDPPVAQNYSITPVHRLMGASLETYGKKTQPQDIINALPTCVENTNIREIFVRFFIIVVNKHLLLHLFISNARRVYKRKVSKILFLCLFCLFTFLFSRYDSVMQF